MYGERAGGAADRDDAVPSAQPLRGAKVYAYWMTVNYREAYGLFAVNGILFNHESPRRGETFVSRKITRAVGRIQHGLQDRLYLGNLEARRDWGYAGDYVEAMWLMLQQDEPDDYVDRDGRDPHGARVLRARVRAGGFELAWRGAGTEEKGVDAATGRVLVEIDPRYLRPTEVDHLQGDASQARERLGWTPTVDFEGLVGADDRRRPRGRSRRGRRPADRAVSRAVSFWREPPRPRHRRRRLPRARTSSSGSSASARRAIVAPRARRLRPARPARRRALPRATRARTRHPRRRRRRRHRRQPRRIPGQFFYENAIMGIQLIEAGAPRRRREARLPRDRSAPIPSTRRCRFARRTSGTATPRRPTRPTASPRRCCWCSSRPTAQEYGFRGIYLLPVNLYGPGDNFDLEIEPRHPRDDPQVLARRRRRAAPRSSSGATARRRASSSTSRTPPRPSCSPPSATTAPSPSTSGSGEEISIRDLAGGSRAPMGYDGPDRLGPLAAQRPARRRLDTTRAREGFGFDARIASTRGWPRRSPGGGRRAGRRDDAGDRTRARGPASRSSSRSRLLPLLHRRVSALGQSERALALPDRRGDGRVEDVLDRRGGRPSGRPRGQVGVRRTPLLEQGARPRVRRLSGVPRAAGRPLPGPGADRPDLRPDAPADGDGVRDGAPALRDHEDKAESGGRLYSNKAPGLAFAAYPAYRALRPSFRARRRDVGRALRAHAPADRVPRLRDRARAVRRAGSRRPSHRRRRRRARDRSPWRSAPRISSTRARSSATPGRRRCSSSPGTRCGAPRRRPAAAPRPAALAGLLAGWAAISEYTVAPVALALGLRVLAGRSFAAVCRVRASRRPCRSACCSYYDAVCFGSPWILSSAREADPAYAALAGRGAFGFGAAEPAHRPGLSPRSGARRAALLAVSAVVARRARALVEERPAARRLVVRRGRSGDSLRLALRLPELARRLEPRQPVPAARACFFAALPIAWALETPLSRGLFLAAAVFSVAGHALLTASFVHFPLEMPWPAATGSLWFLARGWVAPNLGTLLGAGPALSLLAAGRADGLRRLADGPRGGPDAARRGARGADRHRAAGGADAAPARAAVLRPALARGRARRVLGPGRRARGSSARSRSRPATPGGESGSRTACGGWLGAAYSALISKTLQRGIQRSPRRIALCEWKSSRNVRERRNRDARQLRRRRRRSRRGATASSRSRRASGSAAGRRRGSGGRPRYDA